MSERWLALDTSAYSHFRRGHAALHRRLAGAVSIGVPMTVLGELEAAFRLGRRERENRQLLAEFLDEPFVELLPITEAVAARYGDLVVQLQRDGRPIPTNDIWIAATAIESGTCLLTFDQDFRYVSGLRHVVLGV